MEFRAFGGLAAVAFAACSASGTVVFQNVNDNGFFTPFSANTPAGTRFGDSGWLSGFQAENYEIRSVTLGLATIGGDLPGSTDLVFTFNDGDPSGLVFGSGATLFSTTVHAVPLPVDDAGGASFFEVTIPMPAVATSGGFNNIGFSVGVENFDFAGQFGFQCSSAFGQSVGYYTNNASERLGGNWSLFSFGPGAYGVANFVATLDTVPTPGSLGLLAIAGIAASRRRR